MKIAGVLQLVQGLPFLLGGILYTCALIRDLRAGLHEWNESRAFFLILAFLLFLGVCQVCFGFSLTMQKQWATRVAGFICCSLGFVFFPFGTAISGYTLWVLLQMKKKEDRNGN
jgi:vacuolar-type H+-ATPase subunit I/STV1